MRVLDHIRYRKQAHRRQSFYFPDRIHAMSRRRHAHAAHDAPPARTHTCESPPSPSRPSSSSLAMSSMPSRPSSSNSNIANAERWRARQKRLQFATSPARSGAWEARGTRKRPCARAPRAQVHTCTQPSPAPCEPRVHPMSAPSAAAAPSSDCRLKFRVIQFPIFFLSSLAYRISRETLMARYYAVAVRHRCWPGANLKAAAAPYRAWRTRSVRGALTVRSKCAGGGGGCARPRCRGARLETEAMCARACGDRPLQLSRRKVGFWEGWNDPL